MFGFAASPTFTVPCRSVFCLDTDAERLKTAKRFGGIPLLVTGDDQESAGAVVCHD
jgi:hypothetical protein